MTTPNGRFLYSDHPSPPPPPPPVLPPWLASFSSVPTIRPPSVNLSLSPWSQPDTIPDNGSHGPISTFACRGFNPLVGENPLLSELVECCKELEEGHQSWVAHKKEAEWRLKRVELQLESEKASRRKEKMEDIEAKVRALREEQRSCLDRIEAEYREQLAGLRREAEAKEQKLAEQWDAKHSSLTKFLKQMGT